MSQNEKWNRFWGSAFARNLLAIIDDESESQEVRNAIKTVLFETEVTDPTSCNNVFTDLETLEATVRRILSKLHELEV